MQPEHPVCLVSSRIALTNVKGNGMSDQQTDRAQDGTWIKVSGLTPEEESFEDVFHLVPGPGVDHAKHNVGTWSLLGQVLIGTKVGDEIVLNTKKGPMKLTVLKLGSNHSDIL